MKIFIILFKLLTLLTIAFSYLIITPIKAQSIKIDSIFSSDAEIFPFSPNDTIYGLSISGSIVLNSDTSLVRVILTDISGQEWMVYEAYPMIVSDTEFDIDKVCEETSFIEIDNPFSLIINIENSSLCITNLFYDNIRYQSADSLRTQVKLQKEVEKAASINEYIEYYGWQWEAGIITNDLDNLFYNSKKKRYGSKYNLMGLDYYYSGIYKNIQSPEISIDNTLLTKSFDWRKKHDANIPYSNYWDGNPDQYQSGNGWMTKVKNQSPCGACTAFGSVAALEAVMNIYYNYHVDADENLLLSERDAFNCSRFDNSGENVGCICSSEWGKYLSPVMDYVSSSGVVNEECFPWIDDESCCRGEIPDCSHVNSGKCEEEDIRVIIKPENCYHENKFPTATLIERLKTHLMDNGPIICEFQLTSTSRHVMALVGFGSDPVSDDLFWELKNSWGTMGTPPDGYFKWSHSVFVDKLRSQFYYYSNSLICDPANYLQREIYDKDDDGYYNWGIGPIPTDWQPPCHSEIILEDWNDNNKRIGPSDENYIGTEIKPEMLVSIGSLMPIPITNHGFYFFNENPKDFTFRITNPGSAMLHLDPNSSQDGVVSKSGPDMRYFDITRQPEKNELCMFGDESEFDIRFYTEEEDRMHIVYIKIGILDIDKDVCEDFEFAMVFNGCKQTGNDIFIDDYTPKAEFELIPGDIYIERSGILEVTGSLAMFHESDIFIEPGGRLIVNGGIITGITGVCTSLWNGIDVWGSPYQPQTLEYQGKVSVINGGCIEYAEIAIETAHYGSYASNCYPTGGIISCIDAVFKDNITDIRMNSFRNLHPDGHEIPNISRFKRTKFITSDDFYTLFHEDLNTHIFFDRVGGINIMGCTFENNSERINVYRGKGIESYSAGYFIFKACTQDNLPECPGLVACRFENLDYGIRAFNTNSYATIKVDSVDFIHNRRGMHLVLVENPTIIRNTFNMSDPEGFWPGEELAGLYLDQFTSGFVVEENTFKGPGTYSSAVGIQLLNTGTDQNEIYNNSFASLYHGISAVGVNRLSDKGSEGVGLCIKCNDFLQCCNDIYVTCEKDNQGNEICTENTGIAQIQGVMNESDPPYDNSIAAGNTFSYVSSANYFNYDHCGHIDYTYHGGENPSDAKIFPLPIYGAITPQPDVNADYNKIGSCPSHLDGSIDLSMEKSSLTIETSLISAYEDTLLMAIDGGNTEGLNFEILTSFPDEALVLRQELIDESPFLSDTVLISAIGKEDVLPGAMVRDVLVQNPQAPKSREVMDALDQRQDSIPLYMMEEILLGLNTYGAKELLEQELGHHIAKRDQAWKNLNLFYKNDTSNISGSIDSLMELCENNNMLSARYDLAFMHLCVDDSNSAFNVLDDLPSGFGLNAQDEITFNNYLELFNILWDLKHDTTGLDSLQLLRLYALADSYHTIPGLYASNILIKERLLNYDERVYLADPVKNLPAQNKTNLAPTRNQYLKIFPNPAGNYFIAYYYLDEKQYPGLLTISNNKGVELKAIDLIDKQNQIVIPAQGLSSGVYIISLIGRNQLIESQRLTIIK